MRDDLLSAAQNYCMVQERLIVPKALSHAYIVRVHRYPNTIAIRSKIIDPIDIESIMIENDHGIQPTGFQLNDTDLPTTDCTLAFEATHP